MYINPDYDTLGNLDEHKISDGPDGIVGMFCVECFTSWPCQPSKTRDTARAIYVAAREQHEKDPEDWAAIMRVVDDMRRVHHSDYTPYDYNVPVPVRGKQNPVYLFDVPDRRFG